MKKLLIFAAVSAAAALTEAAVTITGVNARQRWPWNGLVDVDFTITGAAAGEAFAIDLSAAYAGGDKKIAAYTYETEPIAGNGSHRITWNMGRDYPEFRAEDLRISVTATPFSADTPIYMVIDLSGGKDAVRYPVRYTTTAPVIHNPSENLQAALADECRTSELWLRRIPAAGNLLALTWRKPADGNNSYWNKLTKDFYIAIFETTQGQWNLLTGEWPSAFSKEEYRAVRPLENFKVTDLRGKWNWPSDKSITDDSVLKKLRNRTGLTTIDLPTQAQFVYAACVGESGIDKELYYYRDPDGNQYKLEEIARYRANSGQETGIVPSDKSGCDLSLGTACVGSYKSNAFGLYDMLGNVYDLCLDAYANGDNRKAYYTENGGFPVVDPEGVTQEYSKEKNNNALRITKLCGTWNFSSSYANLWYATSQDPASKDAGVGFRFVVTCE
jgi:formylglycine-generating enzyme required for sulfatase activity